MYCYKLDNAFDLFHLHVSDEPSKSPSTILPEKQVLELVVDTLQRCLLALNFICH